MPFRCFRSLLLRRQSWRGREEEEEKERSVVDLASSIVVDIEEEKGSSVVDLASSIVVDIEEEKESSVVDLPSSIVVDILSRLPTTALLNCRRVCKNWQYLILQDHPYFTKIRLSRPNLTTDIVLWDWDEECFYLLDLFEVSNYVGPMRFRIKFNIPNLRSVGSCDGLLCLTDHSVVHNTDTVYISNPILGECVALPKPIIESDICPVAYLFGFSPTTGHYKVLRISRCGLGMGPPYYSKAEVYTLVTVTWRSVGVLPFPGGRPGIVNLNGAIHWMISSPKFEELIYSFNVAEEQSRPIPSPPDLAYPSNDTMGLGVLGNCLCVCYNSYNGHYLDMWWMKEYGVAKSWTKVRILRTSIPSGMVTSLVNHCLYPITLWKDGEILFESDHNTNILLSYNPKKGSFTALKVNYPKEKVKYRHSAHTYSSSSFSSLKDVASPGGLRMVDVKSKH